MPRKPDDEDKVVIRSNLEDNSGVDPRRIRKRKSAKRSSDLVKGFDSVSSDLLKESSYEILESNYQKKLEKRAKELEYTGFDHDRKSKARSPMIPVMRAKLVVDDLKAPEITKQEKTAKVTLAKNVWSRLGIKNKSKSRKK